MNDRAVMKTIGLTVCGLLAATSPAQGDAQQKGGAGTVAVRAFDLPVSPFLSPQAQDILRQRSEKDTAPCPSAYDPVNFTIPAMKAIRTCLARKEKPRIEKMQKQFGVTIEPGRIAGVPVQVFMPQAGVSARNRQRVLLNLHGGRFIVGAAPVESIPIAGAGKIKIIGVDYRMAPEHRFPAASEDVAAVYTELLKQYAPASIGIYGCSAGGKLTAQSMAWFQKTGLPIPGAIGIFGSGASGRFEGDSAYFASAITGGNLVGLTPVRQLYYGKDADLTNPLVGPLSAPELLGKFPPTLLIAAIRDHGLSNTARTHSELIKLGVPAELHVWEGLGHCFHLDSELPESHEAYDVIVKFFEAHLGQ